MLSINDLKNDVFCNGQIDRHIDLNNSHLYTKCQLFDYVILTFNGSLVLIKM